MADTVPSLVWWKSKRSDVTGCVEVAFKDGSVLVRDSMNPSGPVLQFSVQSWKTFLDSVRETSDELDLL
jgi:hypothetical protein